ncbi:hypothetical protein M0804_002588 [Polistes exclamans]|nr:hypothetical protein M0804_002588 [Polistes exclamans]
MSTIFNNIGQERRGNGPYWDKTRTYYFPHVGLKLTVYRLGVRKKKGEKRIGVAVAVVGGRWLPAAAAPASVVVVVVLLVVVVVAEESERCQRDEFELGYGYGHERG